MSEIAVGCELNYDVQTPSVFLFDVRVATTSRQRVLKERLRLTPNVEAEAFEVGLMRNSVHRVHVEPGPFRLRYDAVVQLDGEVDPADDLKELSYRELPAEALPFLNPSRYCESDELGNFAVSEFGSLPRGYSRVKAICDWTFQHLRYVSGSTDSTTSASDVLLGRQGVCRDFAHLAIALCRGLSVPARYVSGYAIDLEPPDFHGFFEAYLGERWYLFDATRLAPVGGLVRIASGHDAADVPFATLMGSAVLQEKSVWAKPAGDGTIPRLDEEDEAISTA